MRSTTSNKTYTLKKKIGSGTYGNVYLSTDSENVFACKRIPKKRGEIELGALREISILKMFQNSNQGIVNLVDIVIDDKSIGIIMTKYDMTLSKAIKLDIIPMKKDIVERMLETLLFLKVNGVIHRDLKPDNVLITEDMKPILCDFTLSKLFDGIAGEGTHTGKISTVTYRAPEVVNREPYSFPSEMWSMGIICYELYRGELMPSKTDQQIFKMIKERVKKFKKNSVSTLIKGLLRTNPEKRLTVEEALASDLFNNHYEPPVIRKNYNDVGITEEVNKMVEDMEAEKPITLLAAQVYCNITDCNEYSAAALSSKFHETELRSFEDINGYPDEEFAILHKMDYNLFV